MLSDVAGLCSRDGRTLQETPFPSTTEQAHPAHTRAREDIGQADSCRHRSWERTIIDGLLLFCLLAFVCAVSIRPAASMDEDLWWHLSTGNWILRYSAVPVHDMFGSYTTGKPWIAYSWLFDVLISKVYAGSGLRGILAVTMLLVLGFTVSIVGLLSRYGAPRRAIGLAGLVCVATIPLITPRPWLFSCLFFSVELYLLLEAHERGRISWLLPIVPLFVLWANLHIQFVYGLGVIGIFALERPFAKTLRWSSPNARLGSKCYWVLLSTSVLATLANPYGWRVYTVVMQYATQRAPLRFIEEMQAPRFRSPADWTALFLVCSAFFVSGGTRRKSALMISLLAVSVCFTFRSGRDVWFAAVISALVLASAGKRANAGFERTHVAQFAIALFAALALSSFVLKSASVSPKALQAAAAKRFPVNASAYIESHGMKTPLYNPLGWGGYLIWRLPLMPVSIDGRAELQGDGRVTRFVQTWKGQGNWAGDAELMRANTIVLEHNSALASILRSDARFRSVYNDRVATVFEPVRRHDPVVPNKTR